MNFKLEKINELSGAGATIYSVLLEDEEQSLFEHFLEENQLKYREELKDILKRLNVIGHQTGAREQFFKLEEGSGGDLVCALYDDPDKKLRLYAIRYGKTTVILGGGGVKGKQIRAWQEDSKLKKHAEQMKEISNRIYKRMHDKELTWDKNFLDFEGNLIFKDNEDD